MKRRIFIKQLAMSAAVAAIGFGSSSLYAQGKTIKVGVLHSLSGTMAISETVLKDVTLMAIEDINAKGGVLGMKLEPVVAEQVLETVDEFASKHAAEYFFREQELVPGMNPPRVIRRQSAGGYHAVQVGMNTSSRTIP